MQVVGGPSTGISMAVVVPTYMSSQSAVHQSIGARTHFLEALQSKSKSWDAMIHGSCV